MPGSTSVSYCKMSETIIVLRAPPLLLRKQTHVKIHYVVYAPAQTAMLPVVPVPMVTGHAHDDARVTLHQA